MPACSGRLLLSAITGERSIFRVIGIEAGLEARPLRSSQMASGHVQCSGAQVTKALVTTANLARTSRLWLKRSDQRAHAVILAVRTGGD